MGSALDRIRLGIGTSDARIQHEAYLESSTDDLKPLPPILSEEEHKEMEYNMHRDRLLYSGGSLKDYGYSTLDFEGVEGADKFFALIGHPTKGTPFYRDDAPDQTITLDMLLFGNDFYGSNEFFERSPIWMGNFGAGDSKKHKIDGKSHMGFHPMKNTRFYSILSFETAEIVGSHANMHHNLDRSSVNYNGFLETEEGKAAIQKAEDIWLEEKLYHGERVLSDWIETGNFRGHGYSYPESQGLLWSDPEWWRDHGPTVPEMVVGSLAAPFDLLDEVNIETPIISTAANIVNLAESLDLLTPNIGPKRDDESWSEYNDRLKAGFYKENPNWPTLFSDPGGDEGFPIGYYGGEILTETTANVLEGAPGLVGMHSSQIPGYDFLSGIFVDPLRDLITEEGLNLGAAAELYTKKSIFGAGKTSALNKIKQSGSKTKRVVKETFEDKFPTLSSTINRSIGKYSRGKENLLNRKFPLIGTSKDSRKLWQDALDGIKFGLGNLALEYFGDDTSLFTRGLNLLQGHNIDIYSHTKEESLKENMEHFGIDPESAEGKALINIMFYSGATPPYLKDMGDWKENKLTKIFMEASDMSGGPAAQFIGPDLFTIGDDAWESKDKSAFIELALTELLHSPQSEEFGISQNLRIPYDMFTTTTKERYERGERYEGTSPFDPKKTIDRYKLPGNDRYNENLDFLDDERHIESVHTFYEPWLFAGIDEWSYNPEGKDFGYSVWNKTVEYFDQNPNALPEEYENIYIKELYDDIRNTQYKGIFSK